jgi:sulfoacetaldehyde dehydrogenase
VNATADSVREMVAHLVARARTAQRSISGYSQAQTDTLVTAVAWAGYGAAEELARLAVDDTGVGRYEDKVVKNRRKTLGTLRDLLDPKAISVGVIDSDPVTNLTRIAKPIGVVAALCPSTNPSATPINKTMMALKGRNAVILAPSPKGASTCARVVELIQAQLRKIGAPLDLVQMLPAPVTKESTNELMSQADLVVVTGSQSNVRNAYRSGTPAIGVGAGNVPVVVDASADLADAADKIARSKTFDYATSCSSENSLVILSAVYPPMLAALRAEGAYLLNPAQKAQLEAVMFAGGKLSSKITAQSPAKIAAAAGFADPAAHAARFFLVEEDAVGDDAPFSGEKLSVVLTLYRAATFDAAVERVREILAYAGAGHSCGIHTRDDAQPDALAARVDVVRVLVNQAHCFNNGGSFDNGLNFTLSMGCGSWAKNSISKNLAYEHFINVTHLVRTCPPREPSETDLFGSYLERYGEGAGGRPA